jgi:hypothetical protein
MFQGLRMAKQWKIDADEDGVEIAPVSPVAARMGRVSQFGETITVGRLQRQAHPRALPRTPPARAVKRR